MTGDNLDYQRSTVEKAKFEYFPLGKIFNKGLKGKDKKEQLLKRLKNIKDTNEKQVKDQAEKQLIISMA